MVTALVLPYRPHKSDDINLPATTAWIKSAGTSKHKTLLKQLHAGDAMKVISIPISSKGKI